MKRSPWVWWLLLVPTLCGAVAVRAQSSVALRLSSPTVNVNEAFTVSIEIANFTEAEPPVFPDLPNCTVRALPNAAESSSVYIINGRKTESHTRTYQFEVTPQVVGEVTIPPVTVQVDGRELQTRPATVQVQPSDADELFAVEVSVDRQRIFVGQRVQATMTIWVKPPTYGGQRLDPGYVLQSISAINFGPFGREIRNAQSVGRRRNVGGVQEAWYAFDFAADFVADRVGRLSFSDVEVGIAYPTRAGTRNLRAKARTAPLDVLPVPQEGRPANYNGAVGLYDITTAARPTNVRVGDPIELTIEVFGEGPVDSLPPPLLSASAPLNESFRIPEQTLAGETKDSRRRFTVTIRAKRDDVTAIPPIEYPYFDPDHERFVIARSKAIPLQVTPTVEVTTPDAITPSTPGTAAGEHARLQALDGLRDIQTGEAALLATAWPVTPRLIGTLLLAPPLGFFAIWGGVALVQRRNADPARRRRSGAARTARQRIAQAPATDLAVLAGELAAALAGYLADRYSEPAGRFTGQTAVAELRRRGIKAATVSLWQETLAHCEEVSFGGDAGVDGEALRQAALSCVTALERERR